MKINKLQKFSVLILTFGLLTATADASPRRQRDLSFPRNESDRPNLEIVQNNDELSRNRQEQVEVIRQASRPTHSLIKRPEGETYTQYRDRLEAAQKRLEEDDLREEALSADQREELYRALYALRRETFAGSHSPHGQGAGPGGERQQPYLELQRLHAAMFPDPTADSAPTETGADETETTPEP